MDQNWYFNEVDCAYQTLRGVELENRLKELVAQSRAEYGENSRFYAAILSELGGITVDRDGAKSRRPALSLRWKFSERSWERRIRTTPRR